MRILVVEDDPMLATGLRRALQRAGYAVDLTSTCEEATAALRAQPYALALLDLGLPDGSGLDALRALRARRDPTPVIIVTARDRPEHKVEGLDLGADDYVVKPFDLDELLARIRARMRRNENRSSDVLEARNVCVDLAARTVKLDDRPIPVTAKELKVLTVLMRRAGQFVSKADLEDAVYDDSAEIESNTIEVAVYGLRRKLGGDLILTARGLGYMVPRSP